jgi:hypothetical protein
MSRRSGLGWLALVPATVGLAVTHVWPSIWTLITSFQMYQLPWWTPFARRRPVSFVGLANYRTVTGPFLRAVETSLEFAVFAVLAVLVVAPLLAVAAHVAGVKTRLRVRTALAVPMLWVAPTVVLATTATFWAGHQGPVAFSSTRMTVWTATFGLTTGLAATCYLAVLRRRAGGRAPVSAMLVVAGVALCAVFAYALQAFNYASPFGPDVAADSPGASPLILANRAVSDTGNLGNGAAVDGLLGVILGVLGVVATALLVFSRFRVEVEPAAGGGSRPEADEAPASTPRTRRRARVAAAVILLVLTGITVFSLVPWLSAMGHAGELAMRRPGVMSGSHLLTDTWIPPLISTVVAVGVGVLGGYGIGALRPLGRWSELLLLPFGPWLFVGVGPFAMQSLTAPRQPNVPLTLMELVPPVWLSIPALFLATLVFRTTPVRRALPLLGLVGLATWIGYAQSAVWPYWQRTTTAPMLAWFDRDRYFAGGIGLASAWPVVILIAVGLAVVQRRYLDRLVLSVRSPAGPSVTAPPAPVPLHRIPPAPSMVDDDRAPAPRRLGVKLMALIALAGVLHLAGIVAVVVTILPISPGAPSAADTVTAFYSALRDRSATRALALVARNSYATGTRSLLSDQALRDPGYTPPSQVKVTPQPDAHLDQGGMGQEVTAFRVDMVVAGVAERNRVVVSRAASGSRPGPWRLVGAVEQLPVSIDVADAKIVIAGTRYRDGSAPILVLPGAYVVTVQHPLVEAGPVTIRTGDGYTHLKYVMAPSAPENVVKAVHDEIDKCDRVTDALRFWCPFQEQQLTYPKYGYNTKPVPVALTVVSYPTVTYQSFGGRVRVWTTVPGRIRVIVHDPDTGKQVLDQIEQFSVSGDADIHDDGLIHFDMAWG